MLKDYSLAQKVLYSYLAKTERVINSQSLSVWEDANLGEPQGSIIGSIFFDA